MLLSHLLLSVSILAFILGLPINIFAFHTCYVKLRQEPKLTEMLFLNLAVADLIFLAFLPLRMKEAADNMEWNLPYFLCPLYTIIFFSSMYTITLLVTAVAVQRYLGVSTPFKYRIYSKPRYAVIASVVFWLVSVINTSVIYSLPSMHSDNVTSAVAPEIQKPTKCCDYQYNQPTFVHYVRLELFLVFFLMPFLICCFCLSNYIRITFQRPSVARIYGRRAVCLSMLTLLLFALCFAPYNISHVVDYAHGSSSEGWRELILVSTTFTVCLDSVIFFFCYEIRKAFKHGLQVLLEKICRCGPQPRHCPPGYAGTEEGV